MTDQIENEIPEQENIDNENVVDETPIDNEADLTENADSEQTDDEQDTFPREYVEELRAENAENRVKAKRADNYAQRLHKALVEASGRLQDPSDLPFDETHLEDPDNLTTAIDKLLESKPHLASRRVMGDIGQGSTGNPTTAVNLAAMLNRSAS